MYLWNTNSTLFIWWSFFWWIIMCHAAGNFRPFENDDIDSKPIIYFLLQNSFIFLILMYIDNKTWFQVRRCVQEFDSIYINRWKLKEWSNVWAAANNLVVFSVSIDRIEVFFLPSMVMMNLSVTLVGYNMLLWMDVGDDGLVVDRVGHRVWFRYRVVLNNFNRVWSVYWNPMVHGIWTIYRDMDGNFAFHVHGYANMHGIGPINSHRNLQTLKK